MYALFPNQPLSACLGFCLLFTGIDQVNFRKFLNMLQVLINETKCVELLAISGFLTYFPPGYCK